MNNEEFLLVIDIGNTNITVGKFDYNKSGVLLDVFSIKNSDELAKIKGIKYIAISSVVDEITASFAEEVKEYADCVRVLENKDVDIDIKLDNIDEIGVDRLIGAFMAKKLYGDSVVIVDFGTATTFDVINSDSSYIGGAIAAGIQLTIESLHNKTSKLPLVKFNKVDKVIGGNTVEAMQSGLYFGYIGLVKGIISKIREDIEVKKVIATGGYASMFSNVDCIDVIDENIILKGIEYITRDIF